LTKTKHQTPNTNCSFFARKKLHVLRAAGVCRAAKQ
jgi:hypothetical protein